MGRRKLSTDVAYKVKTLYQERDERGNWRYTQAQIATMLGVGETTIHRAVKSIGAYRDLVEPKSAKQIDLDALASLRKVQAELGLPAIPSEEAVQAELSPAERMAVAIAAERTRTDPDRLTKELIQDGSETRNPLDE